MTMRRGIGGERGYKWLSLAEEYRKLLAVRGWAAMLM
jgi:hypothetical protein